MNKVQFMLIPALLAAILVASGGCDRKIENAGKGETYKQSSNIPTARGSSQSAQAYDVKQYFIAIAAPALDGNAAKRLWASSQKMTNPEVIVSELDWPNSIVYGPDGMLYFIGDEEDAIVAISPSKASEVIARSGVMSYVTADNGERGPIYNTFEGLSITANGDLLTLSNGAYPVSVSPKNIPASGNADFYSGTPLIFVLPSGEKVNCISEHNFCAGSEILNNIKPLLSDSSGRIIFAGGNGKWYRFRLGEKFGEIKNVHDLPPEAYLAEKYPWEDISVLHMAIGSDGYIYAIEQGKGKQDPDRVIRIGDPGLSSLRKEASRVTIAEFRHGELTGALAFSPKGELAVGAENAIYLISPGSAKKPLSEKTP